MLEQKSLISDNNVKSSFADTDDNEVAFLANSGIINGRSETKFAPNDDITREEAAVILTNTAEFMDVKEDITLFDTVFLIMIQFRIGQKNLCVKWTHSE